MATRFQIRRRRRQRLRQERRALRREARADKREARQLRRQTRVAGRQSEAAYEFRSKRIGSVADIAGSAASAVSGVVSDLTGASQMESLFGGGEEAPLTTSSEESAEVAPLEIMGFPAWIVAIVAVIILFVLIRLGKK